MRVYGAFGDGCGATLKLADHRKKNYKKKKKTRKQRLQRNLGGFKGFERQREHTRNRGNGKVRITQATPKQPSVKGSEKNPAGKKLYVTVAPIQKGEGKACLTNKERNLKHARS